MSRFKQGDYTVINKEKYIGNILKVRYLSSWELVLMQFFDANQLAVTVAVAAIVENKDAQFT